MRQFVATLSVTLFAIALCTSAGLAAPLQTAPAAKNSIEGAWSGKISSDSGEMEIQVVIKLVDGKANGKITTPHGEWPIAGGSLKDGVWTLPFAVEGASDRWMKGKVDGNVFSGEWNNAPMAVGTFELTRGR